MTKVALVTGAARGIGKAIAVQLAKDGYDVAITDLAFMEEEAKETLKEIESAGQRSLFIAADSSKKADIVNAVETTYEKLGGFNTMINNAGICITGPLLDITEEDYHKLISINLGGTLFGIQAAAKKLKELKQPGKIINACSIAGQKGGAGFSLYTSSKFAVKGLPQSAAMEFGKDGITVNAYCPGPTFTDMWDKIDKDLGQGSGLAPGQLTNALLSQAALGKGAQATDIANLVSFLASDKSDLITGQSYVIDGGICYP